MYSIYVCIYVCGWILPKVICFVTLLVNGHESNRVFHDGFIYIPFSF